MDADVSRRDHWEAVYTSKQPDEVSWYQAEPQMSLELIRATETGHNARVLDVGGGTSVLVDRLLEEGFENVGVLDISSAALSSARQRLGDSSASVEWIQADILDYRTGSSWDVWHDRAVFHFLVDPVDRARYEETLHSSVQEGGHVIIATFGPEGPRRCSGLETLRCTPQDIERELGGSVRLVEARTESHRTPSGVDQQFVYARLVR